MRRSRNMGADIYLARGRHVSPFPIPETFTDDFNDDLINQYRWSVRQNTDTTDNAQPTPSAVAEIAGQLKMTAFGNATSGCEAGYISRVVNFIEKQFSVELALHEASGGINSVVIVQRDINNRLRVDVNTAGALTVRTRVAGAAFFDRKTVTYNSTTHKYWRIREVRGAVCFDYSSDGVTWVQFWIDGNPFAMDSAQIFLHQNTPPTGVTAGKLTKFDNFTLEPSRGAKAIVPTNVVGGTVAALVFSKTATTNTWNNAGFSSVQSIVGDGFIEWTARSTTIDAFIGLSVTDVDQNYASVLYAFFMTLATGYVIYESGVDRAVTGAIVYGSTIFKIERIGTTLTYYVNGVSRRVVTSVTTSPLIVDVAVYSNPGVIGPIVMG